MENVTQKLADAVAGIQYEQLPAGIIDRVKWIFLDTIGCALGAAGTDKARIAIALADELGGKPQASVIGGNPTSYAQASFVNAELVNTLDYDYIGPLVGHVLVYVIGPCLAMAERQNSSGRAFLEALTIALEVGGRVGNSLVQSNMPTDKPPYYEESPSYTYSHSVFGGVAGAGKLLGFDSNKLQNVFGVAGSSTPVPGGMKWSHNVGPSPMLKYGAWAGWISQLATIAALVTEKGFVADRKILDGPVGYWRMAGSPFFKVENLLDGLGTHWHTAKGEFKPYPVCRCNHAGVDGIIGLMKEHKVRPEEIEAIVVKGDSWLQAPHRTRHADVNDFIDAQFSNAIIFGLAPYFARDPSPDWTRREVYDSPQVRAMAKKVTVDLHPATDALIAANVKAGRKPGFRKTIVELRVKGKTLSTEIPEPRGGNDNPLESSELLAKFRRNSEQSVVGSNAEELIETVLTLEKLDSMRKLAKMWSPAPG